MRQHPYMQNRRREGLKALGWTVATLAAMTVVMLLLRG